MLVAAAVCPHPPLLVPEVAAGAAGELDGVRAACARALGLLAAAGPELVVAVGTAGERRTYPYDAAGSLAGFGADVRVGDGAPVLPLSLTVGRWLADRAGLPVARWEAVPSDWPAQRCLELGAAVGAESARVALLVMGDASARRTEKAPGYVDERAVPFDAAVATALASADAAALATLDVALAADLMAAGRAAWQVLAGAARLGDGPGLEADLLADEAPYGVGYLVASWRR